MHTHLYLDRQDTVSLRQNDFTLNASATSIHRQADIVLLREQPQTDIPRLLNKVPRRPRCRAVQRQALLECLGLCRVGWRTQEGRRGDIVREARRRHWAVKGVGGGDLALACGDRRKSKMDVVRDRN